MSSSSNRGRFTQTLASQASAVVDLSPHSMYGKNNTFTVNMFTSALAILNNSMILYFVIAVIDALICMGVENYIKDRESSQCESLNIEGRLSYSHHECEDGYSVLCYSLDK